MTSYQPYGSKSLCFIVSRSSRSRANSVFSSLLLLLTRESVRGILSAIYASFDSNFELSGPTIQAASLDSLRGFHSCLQSSYSRRTDRIKIARCQWLLPDQQCHLRSLDWSIGDALPFLQVDFAPYRVGK